MKLPNKAVSYKNSILPMFPIILQELQQCDYSPRELYRKLNKKINNISEFTNALSCLFALGMIELTEAGVIHYVKRN
ncbi:TPA: ABC-three component system middle component 7 [Streptococcus suis]